MRNLGISRFTSLSNSCKLLKGNNGLTLVYRCGSYFAAKRPYIFKMGVYENHSKEDSIQGYLHLNHSSDEDCRVGGHSNLFERVPRSKPPSPVT